MTPYEKKINLKNIHEFDSPCYILMTENKEESSMLRAIKESFLINPQTFVHIWFTIREPW